MLMHVPEEVTKSHVHSLIMISLHFSAEVAIIRVMGLLCWLILMCFIYIYKFIHVSFI